MKKEEEVYQLISVRTTIKITYHTKNVNMGFRAYNTLIGYQSNITILTFAKPIFGIL